MSNNRPTHEELVAWIMSGRITTIEEQLCRLSLRTKAAACRKAQR